MEERNRNEPKSSEEEGERNVTSRRPSQAEGSEETVEEALRNDDLAPKEPPD